MRRALVAACVGLLTGPALAAPPADLKPDPVLEAWFQSLTQPGTGQLCCALSNCRFVDYGVRDGHYEVSLDGWRYAVPEGAVLHGMANPTARAVACYVYTSFGMPLPTGVRRVLPQDTIEVLCFVPPRPAS
jgi:hypothetical protein